MQLVISNNLKLLEKHDTARKHTEHSLFRLLCAMTRANDSTHAASLMRVKNSSRHFYYGTCPLGHWKEENQRKNKNIKFNDQPFVSSNVTLQSKAKFLVWSEY